MKLKIPLIPEQINLSAEEKINCIIVENQAYFSDLLTDFSNQIYEKLDGDIVLFENNEILTMNDNMLLMSEFIPFDINPKTLVNKLNNKLISIMNNEDFFFETQELISKNIEYIRKIIDYTDFSLDITTSFDVSCVLKGASVQFRKDVKSLSEKLMEFMKNTVMLERNKCFILVNIRDYISDNEIEYFYKNILYSKLSILVIGTKHYPDSKYEKKIIIDKDLCII